MKYVQKKHLNAFIDTLAWVGFVVMTTTGILMRYLLPPGSGRNATIWGLDRHEWGDLHFWVSLLFLGTLALHLILHWNWIVYMLKGKQREPGAGLRFGLGMVGLIGVALLASAPLLSPVERSGPAKESHEQRSGEKDHEEGSIRGSMTLKEVAEISGVQVDALIQALALPADVSPDMRLGKLGNEYGFDMPHVREVVVRLKEQ